MKTVNYMLRCKCGHAERRTFIESAHGGMLDAAGKSVCMNTVADTRHECGRRMRLERIIGRISETHICGGRCMASKGPSCECSCGGKNHGKNYAA